MLSFATLHNKFVTDNDDGPLYCDTLTQCMYSVLRYGLIDNIGLVNSNRWMNGWMDGWMDIDENRLIDVWIWTDSR